MINLLKINTSSFLKKNKASRISIPYTQAIEIGIIFTAENAEKHHHVKEFVKRLEKDGKKVTVICFLPKNKQNYDFLFDFFSNKDISFWGQITSDSALKFSETSFDYLFYLDTNPNPLILNLLARSKAKCRMGKFWDEGKPYFEFMIQNKGGTDRLIDGMYKYTSLLR